MLRDLHLRNLAVVEEASIEFEPGFNVLTGETGAGKSIVVDSLALLSGVRANAELIRTDADSLEVVGVFEPRGDAWRDVLQEAGFEADDEIVVRREVSRSGRNRVFLNDRPITLKLLTDLAPHLLRIHGQREELGLVAPELQRTWLDRCGGQEAVRLRGETADAFAKYRELARRLERLTGDDRVREERIDLLQFQISEIDAAAPQEGEEVELRRERQMLRHGEAIREGLSSASALLFEDENAAYDAVGQARQALDHIREWEPAAGEWADELAELRIRLSEMEGAIGRRLEDVDVNPGRLDVVESRLAELERLFRKYGATSGDLLAHRESAAAELDDLIGDSDSHAELTAEVEKALAAYRKCALALSEARRGWGEKLAAGVHEHLQDLALAKARFSVRLESRARGESPLRIAGAGVEFSAEGVDHVVYLFAPNPGEEPRSLAKTASGGELSRLYLAVQLAAQTLTSDDDSSQDAGAGAALVFDEVDAGISGAEAAGLGEKLRRLAEGRQILAVTHLPQVASQGDIQFKIRKSVDAEGEQERTRTEVRRLAAQGRVEEIARLLAGAEVTDLSLSHARELLQAAGHDTEAN